MDHAREIRFKIELGAEITVDEARITLYAITDSEPRQLESFSVSESTFSASVAGGSEDYFYVVAEILCYSGSGRRTPVEGRTLQLVTVFEASSELVALSERLSVATSYCFAQFLCVHGEGQVAISDPDRAARIAYLMRGNFVATDGVLSCVIENSPNGLETNGFALFNFLANLVSYSILDPEVYSGFTRLTDAGSLLQAIHHLALDPFVDPEALYSLIAARSQFLQPSLPDLEAPATPVPDQWTLTVKVNDSGAENFMIGGVGYIDFDAHDRVWVANNVRQGTPNSATYGIVLEPDGSPAPFSPIFGGGLLGAGFGVTASPDRRKIYFGNYGWGPTEQNPQHGSISVFSLDGQVLSPSNGYTEGISRAQGLGFDSQGHLWISSWGTQDPMPPTNSKYDFPSQESAAVVYLNGDPERVCVFPFHTSHAMTFDVAFDDSGHAYFSNAGHQGHTDRRIDTVPSSVYKLRVDGDEIRCVAKWVSPRGCETLRQIVVQPGGDVYVGAVATQRVIRLDRDLELRGEYKHNIYGPWGVAIDRRGTMYVSNFIREMEHEAPISESLGPYGVTVIRNEAGHEAKLMTLPTGGAEVTLANGLPLYGNGQGQDAPLHSYDPLMRLTASRIDRAGNLWACNNWKPSGLNDIVGGNPGGDGLVIFVGIAAPAKD